MKNKFTRIFLAVAIITSTIVAVANVEPVSAAASTSVHIVKYAADQTTILQEQTVTYQWMEANLPVQGDGTTHYYTQGPTFEPTNLWDPAETLNLKDKGALKGTNLKDLCNLVGGMGANDTVSVRASDGYGNDIFPYANVYTPDPKQGNMTICWYNGATFDESGNPISPGYVPTYTNGMLLAFFAQTTNAAGQRVFGHQDMKDCFPAYDYHWYVDGLIQYPSTNGAYYKWVSEVKIYTDGQINWGLITAGARTETVNKSHFENCIACHTGNGTATLKFNPTYTDASNNTWSGMPLWALCGLADDDNGHGPGCFNGTLYYDVKVTAVDNYSYTFPSTIVAYNNTMILANKLNGTDLPADKYPLKLVSPSFTVGGTSVGQVARIDLLNISTTPPGEPNPTPTPGAADWPLHLNGAESANVTQSTYAGCVACHPSTYIEGNTTWGGTPLWRIVGYVDDANMHGAGAFNDTLVSSAYRIKVSASDGYYQMFDAASVANNDNIIVANTLNGTALPANTGDPPTHPAYPLKITGSGTSSGSRVGGVVKIELIDLPVVQVPPAWDLNGDHNCNIGDVVAIGTHWRQTGTPGWLAHDLNNDGVVNIGDVVVLGRHWGETW